MIDNQTSYRMLIKSVTNNIDQTVKSLVSDDQILIDCLCEMLENVEKKSRFSTDEQQIGQLKIHGDVIRRALEHNLQLR